MEIRPGQILRKSKSNNGFLVEPVPANDRTSLFEEKLGELPETLRLVLNADHSRLGEVLRESAEVTVFAVGSGGSAITAAFFARCNETLFGRLTQIMTPMEFTVSLAELKNSDVWLFSAGAMNPDFKAALNAAFVRRARRVVVVTCRDDATEVLRLDERTNVSVFVIPIAPKKDSFLATHSLIGSVSSLLIASNKASSDSVANASEAFLSAALAQLEEGRRLKAIDKFATLNRDDLLLIISDPQVYSVASLIETSAWEASLCAVQLTDFRNFAHGRHTWLRSRGRNCLVLSLTSNDTKETWKKIHELLPSEVRRISTHFSDGGRFCNAIGIVQGLVWINAMGKAVGIDPALPGVAQFGRDIYKDNSLIQLSKKLTPALRLKRRAWLERDNPESCANSVHTARRSWLARFSSASVGGIVLDYDGTIVHTETRFAPPTKEIVDELKRLHSLGIKLAIATGRGGSAGEMLRKVLPPEMQRHVLMGYYNGGYVRWLDVDIRDEPPEKAAEIEQVADWLALRNDLFCGAIDQREVQITIMLDNLADAEKFYRQIATCVPIESGAVRIVRSGHSLDLVPDGSSKAIVARRVAEMLGADSEVLRIGDQGSRDGNDFEFLNHPNGISVKDVCGRVEGCWSLFGNELTGPDALLRILMSLKPGTKGQVRFDIESFDL